MAVILTKNFCFYYQWSIRCKKACILIYNKYAKGITKRSFATTSREKILIFQFWSSRHSSMVSKSAVTRDKKIFQFWTLLTTGLVLSLHLLFVFCFTISFWKMEKFDLLFFWSTCQITLQLVTHGYQKGKYINFLFIKI